MNELLIITPTYWVFKVKKVHVVWTQGASGHTRYLIVYLGIAQSKKD